MSCADTQSEIDRLTAQNIVLSAEIVVDQAAVQTAMAGCSAAFKILGDVNTKLASDQQQVQTNNSTISMMKMMMQMNGCS